MLFVCACIHACMAHICVCVHVRACVYACVSVWKFITDFYNWWVFLVYTHSHRLIRVIFKSRTSLSRWQSALLRLKWLVNFKKKDCVTCCSVPLVSMNTWTIPASLLCHRPHRAWSVTGTFYKREVGIPWGGCSGADFTEISKFPEIQGELNMRKQCVPGSFFFCPYTRAWERGQLCLGQSLPLLLLEVSMSLAKFHDWAKEAVRVAGENALASEMLCTRGTETR